MSTMSLLHMYKSSLSPLLQIRFKMTDFGNKRIEKTSKSVDNREINSKEWTFSSKYSCRYIFKSSELFLS